VLAGGYLVGKFAATGIRVSIDAASCVNEQEGRQ